MKTGKHEEMYLPESPKRDERLVSSGESDLRAGSTDAYRFAEQEKEAEARPALDSARPGYRRELAGATARLQRLLADAYPELARLQRL